MARTHGNTVLLRATTCSLLLLPGLAGAGDKPAYDAAAAAQGATTYKIYCASCHGPKAEGDGPLAARFRIAPPDLTLLGRGSDGKYPFDDVYRMIDGRRPVKGHGGPDMPVWGDAFLESHDGYDATRVKTKIEQLAQFLASIQTEKELPRATAAETATVCTFSNPSVFGTCSERVTDPTASSPRTACAVVLACLNDVACLQAYCHATAVHPGWTLDSARSASTLD